MIQTLCIRKMWVSLLLGVVFTQAALGQDSLKSGLRFSSHEVIKDLRTSMNLTPEEPMLFPQGFSLAFDVNFRPGDGHYGNIFRVIGNDQVNIDFVSNLASPSSNFWLVLKDQILFSYTWNDIPEGEFGEWMKIKIGVDTERGIISASLNGNYQEKKVTDIQELHEFRIQFGICKYKSFLNSDVSPMTLKELQVFNSQGELFRHWKLAKHAQQRVYDEVTYAEAEVQNPNWEIDSHIHWKSRNQFQFTNLLGVVKDEQHGQVYFVDDRFVYRYTVDSARVDTLVVAGGQPFSCQGNQMIYHPYLNEIWSYNFDHTQLSRFSFQTNTWSLNEPECAEPDLWHHNRWISPQDSSLVTFGGYGHYTYKSTIHRLNVEGWKPDSAHLQQEIPPRYLSAAGWLGNHHMLIFGGYGSKSGRQEVAPQFYGDLYQLDTRNNAVEKLWEMDASEPPFVPCEYLLPDETGSSFYTLLYNSTNFETSLHLAKFGIATPEKRVFADSIPYKFLDTNSWATFFLKPQPAELIALTVHDSEVQVHSLAYPPLFKEEVYQEEPPQQAGAPYWLILLLLSGAGVTGYMLFRKRRRRSTVAETVAASAPQKEIITEPDHLLPEPPTTPVHKKSAIYLVGGFQVFDQEGEDITTDFTPTLKQLFLLILLTALKNEKGIVSSQLKDTLWFDKSATSARNNLNVNMSKLRGILDRVGHMELQHDHTYWNITLGPEVYCDYQCSRTLMRQLNSADSLTPPQISQLIEIASRGDLCPGLQLEWMDSFKADFANDITDALSSLPQRKPDINDDHHLLLNIAECMLKFDTLNEDAIAMKCSALYSLGKKGLAKHSYDMFSKEYKQVLGENYPVSFNELLHSLYSHTSAPLGPNRG
uniref:Uncharacterized protein n=1 Tax=Roseihalotalea indica TaxID=2867963 RepID=A0AA49GKJ1_9BACT|nr:hypothetical protein K4G66_24055 [Tunicatimonas sp. TK19036]